MDYLKVSEVARQLGCSAEWLREAERRGKIPPASRDINGWRVYSHEDIQAIRALLAPHRIDMETDLMSHGMGNAGETS
jgi:DNA-binding transcriptional MerR regulator